MSYCEASVEAIKTSNPTTCIGLNHTRVDLPNGDSVMYDNRMPDCGGLINCAPKILRVQPTLLPSTPTHEMMTWTIEQFNEFSKQHKLRILVGIEAEWWNGNGPFHDFREQMIEQYLAVIETLNRFKNNMNLPELDEQDPLALDEPDDDLPELEEMSLLPACHLDLKKFYFDNFEWEETIDDHLDRRYDAVNGEPNGSVERLTSTPSFSCKSHLNSRTGMFEFGAITTNTSGYTKRCEEALKAQHQATFDRVSEVGKRVTAIVKADYERRIQNEIAIENGGALIPAQLISQADHELFEKVDRECTARREEDQRKARLNPLQPLTRAERQLKMISYTIPKCESLNLDFDDDYETK